MKIQIISFLALLSISCSKKPAQVIEAMKAAACRSDATTFLSYVSRDEVLKNLAAFYSEGNQMAEVIVAGLAVKMGDKIWDNFSKDVNEGQNSQYCQMQVRASQANENHGWYVMEYATKELYNWEMHKNTAGFQVTKMVPYADFLDFNWGESRESVKKKIKKSKVNEADFNHETRGLFELQYNDFELVSGFFCRDVAFVFFDNRLTGVIYHCPVDSDQQLKNVAEQIVRTAESKYGKSQEKDSDGVLSWHHVNTGVKLGQVVENGKTQLFFSAKDARVDTDMELKQREKKK